MTDRTATLQFSDPNESQTPKSADPNEARPFTSADTDTTHSAPSDFSPQMLAR